MKNRRVRLVVLLALLALSLVALYFRADIQVWARGVGEVAGLAGRPAPELPATVKTLDRKRLRLGDLRGRVVLLHFWTYG
jgi:hypothetical protein